MNQDATDPVRRLVRLALEEDGVTQDVTALSVVPEESRGRAAIVAREAGTAAGLHLLQAGGALADEMSDLSIEVHAVDGQEVPAGTVVAELRGPARRLLALERTVLNFLQRMSGIATETRRWVTAVGPDGPAVMETRKTVPGWRALDKRAVLAGGGTNHRQGLQDMVLVKENHLASLGCPTQVEAVRQAIRRARGAAVGVPLEIEVETLEELDAALEERPDIVMLDGFSLADAREAVRRRAASAPEVQLEISGGLTFERLSELRGLGVDRISVGALTHSVRALDLAIDLTFEGHAS